MEGGSRQPCQLPAYRLPLLLCPAPAACPCPGLPRRPSNARLACSSHTAAHAGTPSTCRWGRRWRQSAAPTSPLGRPPAAAAAASCLSGGWLHLLCWACGLWACGLCGSRAWQVWCSNQRQLCSAAPMRFLPSSCACCLCPCLPPCIAGSPPARRWWARPPRPQPSLCLP